MNPNMFLELIKKGQNPQQLMLAYLQQKSSPFEQNLLNLARNGQTQEIEKIVRNIYEQQGGQDFDQEFLAFKQKLGI